MKILFVATDPLEPTGYAKISSHISFFLADQPDVELYHLAIDYNHHSKNVTNRERHPKINYIDSKISNLCVTNLIAFKKVSHYPEFLWILGVRYIASSILFRRFFPVFPNIMLKILSRGTFKVWNILSKPIIR